METALTTTTPLPTLHPATLEARDATLQEIMEAMDRFAKDPDVAKPSDLIRDIRSFRLAERALFGQRAQTAQIAYFSAAQIGALVGHRQAGPFPTIEAGHEALQRAVVAFGNDLDKGVPHWLLLSHLVGIAALAQKTAEDSGLCPKFHNHPTGY